MKKLILFIIIFILLISCNNKQQQISTNQKRIISLSPHITEIIYALNADADLVAVTDFCKYPPTASRKDKIGGLLNPNIEKIVALKATHLFGVPAHSDLNQELEKFGLQIIMMPNETIEDVLQSIKLISDILGISNTGNQLITSINDTLQSLKIDSGVKTILNGMLIIGREKGSINNITVAGANTFLDEIWNLAGGENIFHDLGAKYSTVNLEEIIKRDPEVIIEFDMSLLPGTKRMEIGKEWAVLKDIKAIKKGNAFVIGGNYSLIPGPRMVKLAKDFNRIMNMAIH